VRADRAVVCAAERLLGKIAATGGAVRRERSVLGV
jgi:hypothetical protein